MRDKQILHITSDFYFIIIIVVIQPVCIIIDNVIETIFNELKDLKYFLSLLFS